VSVLGSCTVELGSVGIGKLHCRTFYINCT